MPGLGLGMTARRGASPALLASRPSLDLDFLKQGYQMSLIGKSLSDLITFTRASAATRYNASGVLETLAINQPRFDHDPLTRAARGLLIEEQRTNLALFSEQFEQAAWAKFAATIEANAAAGPDGNMSADKLVEAATTAGHYVSQNQSVTSGTAYSLSVFVKAAGINHVQLIMTSIGTGGGHAMAGFDLINGTASAAINGGAAAIREIGGGWYRVMLSVTSTATISSVFQVRSATSSSSALADSHLGDGVSGIHIWGAQIEVGGFASSYIPTTSAAATRAADTAQMNVLSPWFNAAEGTVYSEFVMPNYCPAGKFGQAVWQLDDGAGNNRHVVRNDAGTTEVRGRTIVGGSVSASIGLGFSAGTAVQKSAMAFKQNSFSHALNGVLGTPVASGALPSVATLRLGAENSGLWLSGWLRALRYHPRRLTDSQLQSLTA